MLAQGCVGMVELPSFFACPGWARQPFLVTGSHVPHVGGARNLSGYLSVAALALHALLGRFLPRLGPPSAT